MKRPGFIRTGVAEVNAALEPRGWALLDASVSGVEEQDDRE